VRMMSSLCLIRKGCIEVLLLECGGCVTSNGVPGLIFSAVGIFIRGVCWGSWRQKDGSATSACVQ
jgi:hypothetical protein